ncbi:peptidyl-tRNA hydrolase ICT1, mitochondrial [Anoplophora glabripennis]|uniref:peptidyl-tRNA hydrolase ICT1, mitochondrial n=1 Tax=Anoplophora glabripennis TaxID=217634 RepID=UPI00087575B1|nr:peptidyl-tRNA hydrolase ICT1, mitochondrial [Anoplophora glabripennis]
MNVFSGGLKLLITRNISKGILKRSVAFKSVLSLDNLYPSSSLELTTPNVPVCKRHEKFSGYIPIDELNITYSRSSGPGGQNVNKVNTKVDVRFHLQSAKWLNDELKNKLFEKLKSKITKEGYLIYKSDLTRSQQLNLADCLEKIRNTIYESVIKKPEPSPETEEIIRRRMEKAAKERLMQKRHKSILKNERRAPVDVL